MGLFSGIGSIIGGIGSIFGGGEAKEGARDIATAASRGIADFRGAGERAEDIYAPYVETGEDILQRLSDLLIGGDVSAFQESPGFRFMQEEGQRAIERSAAARGGLVSGRTLKELQERGTELANVEFGDYVNRLQNLLTSTGGRFAPLSAQVPFNVAKQTVPLDIGGQQAMMQGNLARTAGTFGGLGQIAGGISSFFEGF